MIKHNLLLLYRNFRRFRGTFFINLIGLSTGLTCALLIWLWVSDELGVDKFHENDSQLFQVMINQNRPDGIVTTGEGPALLAEALQQEMPEIEYAVGASPIDNYFTLSGDPEKHITALGQFADKDFFTIFSYPLLQGDKKKALTDKHAIVISETTAMALFGTTQNIIGRSVEWQAPHVKRQVTVTGIFKDLPVNSSNQFDFMLAYESYKELLGGGLHWGNLNAITYVQLQPGTDLAQFNNKIEGLVKRKAKDSNLTIFLKPYSENYLYGNYDNGKVAGGRIAYVRLFSLIAIFIVIIACINFMNLATAKASRRIREVGIKKAIGAARQTLILQYLAESMLMTFVSLALAIFMVDLLLPQFNAITGKQLTFSPNISLVLSLVGITLFTGLLAGSYPALYLSRFSPAVVLKGKLHNQVGEQWARKGLVVFQFALSVIFIVSVLVINRQISYVQTKNLGYNKDNILYFNTEGRVTEQLETFLTEVRNVPGVVNASSMWGNLSGLTGFTTGSFDWEGRNDDEIVQFEHLGVNYDILEMLGIEMVEGRTFSRNHANETKKVILNEAAIEVMGLKDPVGKIFNLWGNDLEIIGIARNFHFKSLHENVKPFFVRLTPNEFSRVLVKIEGGKEKETIARLQKLYKAFNPGFAFDHGFLDDEYQAQYITEKRVASLSEYFAALAILISCLGLFGLAAFTAERRLKEIGIRKVLGASTTGIVLLLSRDFTKIVVTAIVIALPVSYFITTQWLNDFAFRITLAWWYFAGAGAIAMVIAWITVGTQSLKAARVNPTQCLKDE
ncbi:ABC transporter permease [Fulvivirgaceae bacterium PWU4]|uniref:ABC transporter permease n=1 Tax=Chryseosolibacter histidini TaxID=2782349 RepID=A0AAP2GKM4_9BACT|nr:ABC transporter permease [Chryseosolibacter histidini]MBT1699204.1 ABC transporter permease [Chryseosolibacter histidini]